MKNTDRIFIRGQKVSCHIGVPDEERSKPQELLIHSCLIPSRIPQPLDDDIEQTIDYHAVYLRIIEVASKHPRKLVETLAEDLAEMILSEFAVREVTIEIEKFILPDTESVGVAVTRTKLS